MPHVGDEQFSFDKDNLTQNDYPLSLEVKGTVEVVYSDQITKDTLNLCVKTIKTTE